MKCTRIVTTALAIVLMASLPTFAIDVPNTMTYQGRLLDDLGDPVDASPMMTFAIYHEQSSGSAVWQETHQTVMVQNGIFSVILGSQGNPIPDSAFASTECWLEITVDAETLLPRTLLTAMPFTFAASTVKGDMETAPGKLTLTDASKGGGFMEFHSAAYGNDLLMVNANPADQGRFGLYDFTPESPMMEMRADGDTRDFSIYMGEPIDEGHISFYDMTGAPDTCLQISFSPSTGARIRMGEPGDEGKIRLLSNPTSGATIKMGEPGDEGRGGLELLQSLVDGATIRMGEPGDEGVSLELRHDPSEGASIRMGEPGDEGRISISRVPSAGGSIRMGEPIDDGVSGLELRQSSAAGAMLLMSQPSPGWTGGLTIGFDPTLGSSIRMGEPGDERTLVEVSAAPSSGASILMFNPQPEPPGAAVMELYRDVLRFANDCGSGKLSLRTNFSKCGMAVDDTAGETLMVANEMGIYMKAMPGKAEYDSYLTPTEFKLGTGGSAGHVLTSDANGVGTWQPVGASSSCGVSQGVDSSDDDTLYSSSTKTIMSQSIDCPADGYVLAMASCDGTITHFSGSPRFMFGITNTEGSLPSDQRKEWWVDFASGVTGPISEVISVQKIFPVTEGSNTFYFSGYKSLSSFSSDSCYIDNKTFSLVFIPYSYGVVATMASMGQETEYDETIPAGSSEIQVANPPADLYNTEATGSSERIAQLESVIEALTRRIEQLEQRSK